MTNPLTPLRDLRHGPPLLIGERMLYADPSWNAEGDEDLIEGWDLGNGEPVFDPEDLVQLLNIWTTCDPRVDDNGVLHLINLSEAERHVEFKPVFFQDASQEPTVRIGWNLASYALPGQRWKSMGGAVSDKSRRQAPPDALPPQHAAALHAHHHLEDPTVRTLPITATLRVHFDEESIVEMADDDNQPEVELTTGDIHIVRKVTVDQVREAALEEINGRFPTARMIDGSSSIKRENGDAGDFIFEADFEF